MSVRFGEYIKQVAMRIKKKKKKEQNNKEQIKKNI